LGLHHPQHHHLHHLNHHQPHHHHHHTPSLSSTHNRHRCQQKIPDEYVEGEEPQLPINPDPIGDLTSSVVIDMMTECTNWVWIDWQLGFFFTIGIDVNKNSLREYLHTCVSSSSSPSSLLTTFIIILITIIVGT